MVRLSARFKFKWRATDALSLLGPKCEWIYYTEVLPYGRTAPAMAIHLSLFCILATMLVESGSNALLIPGFFRIIALQAEKQVPENVESEPPITP